MPIIRSEAVANSNEFFKNGGNVFGAPALLSTDEDLTIANVLKFSQKLTALSADLTQGSEAVERAIILKDDNSFVSGVPYAVHSACILSEKAKNALENGDNWSGGVYLGESLEGEVHTGQYHYNSSYFFVIVDRFYPIRIQRV